LTAAADCGTPMIAVSSVVKALDADELDRIRSMVGACAAS
jgi:hypothetical protein